MIERVDEAEILARNPQIDQDQLAKAKELRDQLRAMGVRRKGYDLAPPFGGRRIVAHDDGGDAPHLVRSRRLQTVE